MVAALRSEDTCERVCVHMRMSVRMSVCYLRQRRHGEGVMSCLRVSVRLCHVCMEVRLSCADTGETAFMCTPVHVCMFDIKHCIYVCIYVREMSITTHKLSL